MALNIEILSHPPYFPEFSICHPFKLLKYIFLEEKEFINCKEIKTDIECLSGLKLEQF